MILKALLYCTLYMCLKKLYRFKVFYRLLFEFYLLVITERYLLQGYISRYLGSEHPQSLL